MNPLITAFASSPDRGAGLARDMRIRGRPKQLTARVGNAEWLDGAFSIADILMVHVLRRLEGSGILEEYSTLCAYIARAQARPAFQHAFAAQLAVFTTAAAL